MRLEQTTIMDSDSVVSSSKRLRSNEGEDMISNLPDFIIGHVLSLVPIQDAVRTCVLSKRWKYLWTFISNLFFQDRVCNTDCELLYLRDSLLYAVRHRNHYTSKENQSFLNLVNGVMLRETDSSIHSFTLIISEKYDPAHVNEWISAGLHRRVKKLRVYTYKNLPLPSYSLLQFLSLEVVVLMVGSCVVRVPDSACFTSLTVLKLSGITFTPEYFPSGDSETLTLKFPALREYATIDCNWYGVKNITFEVPLLQEVSIVSFHHNKCPRIKFSLSHLRIFYFAGYVLPPPWFLDISAATIAKAYVLLLSHDLPNGEEVKNQTCKLFKQFTANAECLRFYWSKAKVVEQANDLLRDLPTSMLRGLELDSVSMEFLLGLLLRTPVLNTLMICKEILQFDKELLISAIVPDCFRSNLEMVEFKCFSGFEHELGFVKFVIENAQVLWRIRLIFLSGLCHSVIEEAKEKDRWVFLMLGLLK